MLAGAASLKVIARSGVGYDSIVDNVLITSHLAGQTIEARERAGIEAAQAVIDVLEGREPTHVVA